MRPSKRFLLQVGRKIRKDLDLFAKQSKYEIYPKSLCGACCVSAYQLVKVLKEHNIKAKVHTGFNSYCGHAWVETEDYLIDLTYTQFNRKSPKILIVSKKEYRYKQMRKRWDFISVPRSFADWTRFESPRMWKQIQKALNQKQKTLRK